MKNLSLLIFALLYLTPPAWTQTKGPKLIISATGWEFGVRSQGIKDTHDIKLKNVGDADVKILDIKFTCGCVRGEVLKKNKTIRPDEEVVLRFFLNTYRQVGRIRKHCYVYTNENKGKPHILTINGDIKPDWWPTKKALQFGSGEAGLPYTQTFKVLIRDGKQQIKIVELLVQDPNIVVTHKPLPETKDEPQESGFLVTVTLMDTAPSGPFAASLAVRTTHNLTPIQNVRIYAKLQGPIKIHPMKLFVGRVFFDQQVRRTMRVSITDMEGYSLLGSEGTVDSISSSIREIHAGMEWEVEVIITGNKDEPTMNESLVLNTNHPLHRKIVVPVQWVSRAKPAGR